jgi:hypothetical protein
MRKESDKTLQFERLDFEKAPVKSKGTKVGGEPNWSKNRWDSKGANELYKLITYMGGGVVFLMQTENTWVYTRLPNAPKQFEDYPDHVMTYKPFNGPFLYFLGTTSPQLNPPRVLLYALA